MYPAKVRSDLSGRRNEVAPLGSCFPIERFVSDRILRFDWCGRGEGWEHAQTDSEAQSPSFRPSAFQSSRGLHLLLAVKETKGLGNSSEPRQFVHRWKTQDGVVQNGDLGRNQLAWGRKQNDTLDIAMLSGFGLSFVKFVRKVVGVGFVPGPLVKYVGSLIRT